MSRRRQQSENALFIFCLLKNIIQPLTAKDFHKTDFMQINKQIFMRAYNVN
jgi:hypothetical protein